MEKPEIGTKTQTEKEVPSPPSLVLEKINTKLGLIRYGRSLRAIFTKKGRLIADLYEIFPSVYSSDRPTRRMALLFLFSCIGLGGVLTGLLVRHYSDRHLEQVKKARYQERKREEIEKKSSLDARRSASTLILSDFSIELNAESMSPRVSSNMAIIDIALLCDCPETREYLFRNKVQVRNQITQVLGATDREVLLSREGKKKLRLALLKKLNEWLTFGKIEDLFFSKLILN